MPGQLAEINKLCILRLSAIGDVCHAVAMVQHIQRTYPNIEITWVIGKVEASLLSGLPGIRFVVFDKKAGKKAFSDLRAELKDEYFDVLLHMQVAFRASIASLMIHAKRKIGFDKFRAKEAQWLFTNERIEPHPHPHVLDGFFGFAKAIGCAESEPTWQMPIADQDQLWASEQFAGEKPIAIICPAASKKERNWHVEGYSKVAQHLIEKGFVVALCGGPTSLEQDLASQIEAETNAPLINLVGKTTLKQMLASLKLAHLLIAPDTGPAHMAVTVGTPVVGLYAHSNPHRTGPYLYQQYVVSCYQQIIQEQQGKPLSKLPWGVRAKGDDLMDNIKVDDVLDKVRQLLADHYPELTE